MEYIHDNIPLLYYYSSKVLTPAHCEGVSERLCIYGTLFMSIYGTSMSANRGLVREPFGKTSSGNDASEQDGTAGGASPPRWSGKFPSQPPAALTIDFSAPTATIG
jgi:hypothetical protein